MLQFYSASTSIVNSRRAITECLEVALEGEPNLDCDLIIIYTAMGHNFKELLTEAKILSPNARIVGCTCAGVIGREGPNETLKALAIMAIKGPSEEFAVAGCETMVGQDPFEITARMAQDLKNKNSSVNMIHFLPSTLDVWPADRAILGIESVFGKDIPIFGGCSIDNNKMINTFQFLDDQIFERGAIMVGLADPTLGIVSKTTHGLNIQEGMSFEVTRAKSNCVYELNGQPAWKIFTESLGMPESSNYMEAAVIAVFAVLIPEEFRKEWGSKYKCIGIMGKNEDNSIRLPTVFEEGSALYIAKRDEKRMFDGVDQILKEIVEFLQGKEKLAVFHADCSGRGKFSFNRILKDEIINRMQYPICKNEPIPWLGLYSGGEFAMIGQHNQILQVTSTLSVLYRQTS